MASIVSGLGKLFHTVSTPLAPQSARGQRQLESVTEEAHTYDLLFPELGSLPKSTHYVFPLKHGDPSSIVAAANSSDERGGLNIQPQDIRFIVGQHVGGQSSIISDTHPPILSSTGRRNLGENRIAQYHDEPKQANTQRSRTAPHTRQSSLSQSAQSGGGSPGLPLSPVSEVTGIFGREGRRPNTSDGETVQSQQANEERQETDAMLSSMFGATGHRISAGMKVHIKPFTTTQSEADRPVSPSNPRLGSQRRKTPLTRSTTVEDLHSFTPTPNYGATVQQPLRRQSSSILVTKIFYVDSTDEDSRPAVGETSNGPVSDDFVKRRGFDEIRRLAVPLTEDSDQTSRKHRTPAFALAMVIYVRPQPTTSKLPSFARASPALGQNPLSMASENNHQSTEAFDGSVEYIMAHWDTIMRTLSSLEIVVRCELSDALSKLDVPISAPMTATQSSTIKPSRIRAPPPPYLQLPVGALQHSTVTEKILRVSSQRIASALQIRGVTTGQGRWGVWREEARGVGHWAGGREQNFFFFNLLTAFLGNHTEWLDVMSSKLSRGKRSRCRDQLQSPQHNVIRYRTVIISRDKMAARRLVFLLSSFLPPAQASSKRHEEPKSDFSNSIPTSSSPLTSSFLSDQMSLRKIANKRQLDNGWKANLDLATGTLDAGSATESSDDRTITDSPDFHRKNSISHNPNGSSDAGSVSNAMLPATSLGPRLRKAGTSTTATILPECAIPVAHFSSIFPEQKLTAAAEQRPGSSSSIASLALHRTLSRSDSMDHSGTSADSRSTGGWFWHSRRGSSTETSETPISSAEGLGIFVPKDLRASRPRDKLASMVDDASVVAAGQNTPRPHPNASQDHAHQLGQTSHPKDIPRGRDMIEPFPLDLSVNESDGVIDVKLPSLGSQSSSFGSFTSSPRVLKMGPHGHRESLRSSSPSLSPNFTFTLHPQLTSISEVAGWLTKFHQDLALQALKPYDTLRDEVKHAMRTESVSIPATNPAQDGRDNAEDWRDVCVTLIADTTTFTLTRMTLRRKNATRNHHRADALLGLNAKDNPDEEFFEESLIEHDATLTDAVEKILSHSGQSSHIASRGASRNPSRPPSPAPFTAHSGHKTPPVEVPKSECRKMVLGALEQVAKSVRSEMTESDESKRHDDNETKDPLREGVRRWFEEVGLTSQSTANVQARG